jgi:hypothetical protein
MCAGEGWPILSDGGNAPARAVACSILFMTIFGLTHAAFLRHTGREKKEVDRCRMQA